MPSYTPLVGKTRHSLNAGGSPYTWTPPQGITNIDVLIVGGGAGAGSSFSGSGGTVIQSNFTVVKGTTYTLTVGAGGTGGVSPTNGSLSKINDGSNDIFNAPGGFNNPTNNTIPTTHSTIRSSINSVRLTNSGAGKTGGSNTAGDSTEFALGGSAGANTGAGGGASFNDGGNGDPGSTANNGGGGGWDVGEAATDTINDHGDGGDGRIILVYRLGSGISDNVPS